MTLTRLYRPDSLKSPADHSAARRHETGGSLFLELFTVRISSNANLVWKGDDLHHTAGGKPVAQIVPDAIYPLTSKGQGCLCNSAHRE